MSAESSIKLTFVGALAMFVGLQSGTFLIAFARVWWYEYQGLTPEMHPGIGLIFFPLLAIPYFFVCLLIEWLLRLNKLTSAQGSILPMFIVGVAYSSMSSLQSFPPYFWHFAFVNPISLRMAHEILMRHSLKREP
jgi:hypothetical protein